jgi:hypothetical protein
MPIVPPVVLNQQQKSLLAQQQNTGTGDFMANLNAWAQAAAGDPSIAGAISSSAVMALLGVMVAAGLVDIGADPLDEAAGRLIARLIGPVMDATITGPMEAALSKFFRYKGPNVSNVIRLLEEGMISAPQARAALELDGIAEPFIGPLISRGLARFYKASLKDKQAQDQDTFKAQLGAVTTQLDLLKDDISRFSSDARAARNKYLTYSRRLKRSPGTAATSQGYIDDSLADAATTLDDINGALAVLDELSVPEGITVKLKPRPQIPTNWTPVDVANLAYWLRDLHIAIGRAWAEANLAQLEQQHQELSNLAAVKYEIPGPTVKPTAIAAADPFTGQTYASQAGDAITLTAPASAAAGDVLTIGLHVTLTQANTYLFYVKDDLGTIYTAPSVTNLVTSSSDSSFTYTMPNRTTNLTAQLYLVGSQTPTAQGTATITLAAVTPPPVTPTCPTGQHWDAALQKCVADVVTPPPVTPVAGDPSSFTISGNSPIQPGNNVSLVLHIVGPSRRTYKYTVTGSGIQTVSGSVTLDSSGVINYQTPLIAPEISVALTVRLLDPATGAQLASASKYITVQAQAGRGKITPV